MNIIMNIIYIMYKIDILIKLIFIGMIEFGGEDISIGFLIFSGFGYIKFVRLVDGMYVINVSMEIEIGLMVLNKLMIVRISEKIERMLRVELGE